MDIFFRTRPAINVGYVPLPLDLFSHSFWGHALHGPLRLSLFRSWWRDSLSSSLTWQRVELCKHVLLFFSKNIFKHQYWRSAPARCSAEDKSRDFREAAAELIPFIYKKKRKSESESFFWLNVHPAPPLECWCRLSIQQMSVVRRVRSAYLNRESHVCGCCCWYRQHFWTEALQVNKLCLFNNCQPESKFMAHASLQICRGTLFSWSSIYSDTVAVYNATKVAVWAIMGRQILTFI